MDFKDYYATLGVPKTATDKELKQAYRKLARTHHPDVNPGDKAAETRFKEINEAYEVLGDQAKRKKYDELGANWRMYEQGGAPPPGAGTAWNVNPGGPGGFRTMTEDEMRDLFGSADPFSDFFHTFFGGSTGGGTGANDAGRRGRGRSRVTRQGRDVEHDLPLSLEDVFHGARRALSLTHDGHARSVEVRIPAGVSDGSRLRVAGEGERGVGGAPAGDLYLRIRVAPHAVFERRGHDLHARVTVPLTTAVLGGETTVHTLAGKALRLKVPAMTQNGQVLRLKGHGMPAVGKSGVPGESGDLYATVEVQLPRSLTAAERTHFEALRQLETDARSSHAS